MPLGSSYREILWWLYRAQNKAWSMFPSGSEFKFLCNYTLCMHFATWHAYLYLRFWSNYCVYILQKAVKRKANFEQSKKLKERLESLRKETAETEAKFWIWFWTLNYMRFQRSIITLNYLRFQRSIMWLL